MKTAKRAKRHTPMKAPASGVAHEARYCGAAKRADDVKGEPCRNVAGFKTDHPGVGRCFLHGGRNPVKHGRYSGVMRENLRGLIEQHEADPDPLNIMPELAAARALFQDYIERYDEWRDAILAWHASFATGETEPKPRTVLDLSDAYRIVSEVTKIVERIEGIRAKNAVSRPELHRIISEMWRVVELHVADEPTRQRLRDGWLGIRL